MNYPETLSSRSTPVDAIDHSPGGFTPEMESSPVWTPEKQAELKFLLTQRLAETGFPRPNTLKLKK